MRLGGWEVDGHQYGQNNSVSLKINYLDNCTEPLVAKQSVVMEDYSQFIAEHSAPYRRSTVTSK